jgi:hypothetical protein
MEQQKMNKDLHSFEQNEDRDPYLESIFKSDHLYIVKNKWNRLTGDFISKNMKVISNWEN